MMVNVIYLLHQFIIYRYSLHNFLMQNYLFPQLLRSLKEDVYEY
jgi:hypothetical protein